MAHDPAVGELESFLAERGEPLPRTAVLYGNDTWWTAPGGGQGGAGPAPGCIRGHEIALGGGAGNGWPGFIRSQLARHRVRGGGQAGGRRDQHRLKLTVPAGFRQVPAPAAHVP